MTRNPAARLLARALVVAAVALAIDLLAGGGLSVLERRGVRYQPILGDRLSAENRQAIEDFLGGRESPFQLDSVLGWTLRPRFRSPKVAVDAVGRRRAPDRPPPESNAVRLAAFGDSFTFGGDVVDRDAYPEAFARLDQGIDVANYGVPAYGLDQAFLRYLKERRAARPQVVIIGYLSENICRNVSVFRPFYNPNTVFPLAKPRYLLDGRGLRLLRNPLPTPESYRRLLANPADSLAELGRHDAYYRTRPHARPWDRSATVRLVKLAAAQLPPASRDGCYGAGEAFSVTTRLFSLFYETALRDGAQPVILIFPTREEVASWRSFHRKRYAPLLSFLGGKDYRVVDAMEVFDGAGRNLSIDELIPAHLSPLANTLVAEYLRQRLQSFGLIRTTMEINGGR
jgi:hypothetical protein